MDEQVIQDLFDRAVSKGYNKTLDEFKILLTSDTEVIDDSFQYVTSQGYSKSIDDFRVLIGAEKKKDVSESTSVQELLDSPGSTSQTDITSDTSEEVEPTDPLNIPEVLEEEVVSEEPSSLMTTDQKKEILTSNSIKVDELLRAARAGASLERYVDNPEFGNVVSQIDMSTSDDDAIDLLYNTYITNRVMSPTNLEYDGSNNLKSKTTPESKVEDVVTPSISVTKLSELNIDQDDFARWEKETQRKEDDAFKVVKNLLSTTEGEVFEREQKEFEKLASYKASIIKKLQEDIQIIDAKILSGQFNEVDVMKLQSAKSQLGQKFLAEVQNLKSLNTMFPTLQKEEKRKLDRRKRIYELGQSDDQLTYTMVEAGEILKGIPNTLIDFSMNTVALIPALIDQTASLFGADDKGFFAGLNEMILDAAERGKESIDQVERGSVVQGKEVTLKGKEYFVTTDNEGKPLGVLDKKTLVSMDGIISTEQITEIMNKSKTIPNELIDSSETSLGAGAQGFTSVVANLMALIRGGKKLQKTLGVSPSAGMGLSSYASRAASEVEDMKKDLIASGMTEKEAETTAMIAGNSIATLDGIFSSLAGSNEKLLGPLTAFKQQVKNLVKDNGKNYTKKKLISEIDELFKENMKEVFVEELPVLFSEKAINSIVNTSVGTVVRSSAINNSEIIETVAMTIGATSGLGGTSLLSGNNRSSAVRFLAQNTPNFDKTVEKLINEGSITLDEAQNLKAEVYEMKTAELQTKGTIKNTDNLLEASSLLQQRKKLVEQKEGLEGPLKEDIDKKIEALDIQINQVSEKDKKQTQDKLKQSKDAIQESSTEKVDVQEQSTDGQTVGERDTEGAVTQEGKKETEDVLVESKEAEVAPVTDEVAVDEMVDSKGRKRSFYKTTETQELEAGENVVKTKFTQQIEGRERRIKGAVSPEIAFEGKYEIDQEASGLKGDMEVVSVSEMSIPEKSDSRFQKVAKVKIRGEEGFVQEFDVVLKDKKEIAKQEQVREKIDKPFSIPNSTMEVRLTPEGKVDKIYKKGTNTSVNKTSQAKAGKYILTNVIDVNDGKEAVIPQDVRSIEEAGDIIADESQNVKQIAETIKTLKDKVKETKLEFSQEQSGIFAVLDLPKFSTKSIRDYFGVSPKEMGISTRWHSKDGISLEDGWVGYGEGSLGESGITADDIADFITQYGTQAKINELTKGGNDLAGSIVNLESKFKELTGLSPTPTNIKTVLSIDSNREPLKVTEVRNVEQLSRESLDPDVDNFGKKKGPTPEKITGKKRKKVKVDEESALKDQIKLEAKAARDAAKDTKSRISALGKALNSMASAGIIPVKKAKQLIKKITGTNVSNPKLVERTLAYVDKVLADIENVTKINNAEKIKKRIRKQVKNEKVEANVKVAVEQFLMIDPLLTNDLDGYIQKANEITKGLQSTKKTKTGVSVAPAVDINSLDAYSNSELEAQQEKIFTAQKNAFQDLTGLDPEQFSLNEMREILQGLNEGKTKVPKDKEKLINDGIKKAYDQYSSIVRGQVEAGVDPFTGETVNIDSKTKSLIKEFLNVDISALNTEQKMRALNAMVNFATNQTTGGMQAIVDNFTGINNVKQARIEKLIAKPLNALGLSKEAARAWSKYLAQLPLVMEYMFKGQTKALRFENLSGFGKIRRGSQKTRAKINQLQDAYAKEFLQGKLSDRLKGKTKTMPNGKLFNDVENDLERGMFAFMNRTVQGTESQQQAEFKRRKGLIEQTIEKFKQTGKSNDLQKAQDYENVYNKILKNANNISEVESNVDPVNVEAVNWMTEKWADSRQELEDVSLNIYNRVLGKDINYTPDTISLVDLDKEQPEIGEPIFQGYRETFYDEKTGVLKEKTMENQLPTNRVVNLSFDSNNFRNLESALTDINTAGGIQQLKGFTSSPDYESVIPDGDDRALLTERFRKYVDAKRGVSPNTEGQQLFIRRMNRLAGLGVSRVLGGPTQFIKQLTPLVNTAINLVTSPKAFIDGIILATANKDFNQFLNNSGYEIATRGLQSITNLEAVDTKIRKAANSKFGKAIDGIGELQNMWLKLFLQNPDRFAARASWGSYYLADLQKQGFNTSGIDWATHKINDKAAQYAEQQVARQQNTSDIDLQGSLFASKTATPQIIRKIAFPFANFLINQKSRMYADLTTLASKTSTQQDKVRSGKSLVGLIGETAAFNALGLAVTQMLASLSMAGDDEEEIKEKAFQNRVKGRIGNVIKDVLSPIPYTDGVVIDAVNELLKIIDNSDDPYQLFSEQKKDLTDFAGVLGIGVEQFKELIRLAKMGVTGKVEKEFGGKKTFTELPQDKKDALLANFIAYLVYSLGLTPLEVGSIVRYNLRDIEKTKQTKPPKIKPRKKLKPTGGPSSPLNKKKRSSGFPKSPIKR